MRIPAPHRFVTKLLASEGYVFPHDPLFELVAFLFGLRNCSSHARAGIVALVGKPGSGKSFLLERVASVMSVRVLRISLADCESSSAGEPAARLRSAALEAQRLRQQGFVVLIVIDDADLGLADAREGEGSTTNRPQLIGLIQELVDGRCTVDGKRIGRQFFAFTMNSTVDVRKSLLRDMRCVIIEHDPSTADRERMARHELSGLLSGGVLNRQIKRLGRMSIAEIAAVKEHLRQMIDRMIAMDMAWTPYQAWLTSERGMHLIDAVGRRVLGGRDVRHAIDAVRQRSNARKSYL
ncbi:MAG: AAA family ATPase [Phycisphaeraceae bacterium]